MRALIAASPITLLLVCLLLLRMRASKAGTLCLLFSGVLSITAFGMNRSMLSIACGKGGALALYVLLIIWSAVLLYNVVVEAGAIASINAGVARVVADPFCQGLFLSWLFAPVLQGIAGFGVPVIIVVPILVALGFDPLKAACATLIGHSWAVSFGSMGSSFYTITLVTGLEPLSVGLAMVAFDLVAMVCTGLSVCLIYGGVATLRRGLCYILPLSTAMAAVAAAVVYAGAHSLVGLLSALSGLILGVSLYRFSSDRGSRIPRAISGTEPRPVPIGLAILPYALVIILSLVVQGLRGGPALSFSFPAFETGLGHAVKAEPAYARVRLFGHPAPVLWLSSIIAWLAFLKGGAWRSGGLATVIKKTVSKCVPTTLSLLPLIAAALVMMDSGMTDEMARGVSALSGKAYLVFAPFIGVLGSFITGSNTNSNVIFGRFQLSVAQALGVSGTVMAGLQSIAGSVGVAIGPTNVLVAASAAGLVGKESLVYTGTLKYVLVTAIVLGVLGVGISSIFPA